MENKMKNFNHLLTKEKEKLKHYIDFIRDNLPLLIRFSDEDQLNNSYLYDIVHGDRRKEEIFELYPKVKPRLEKRLKEFKDSKLSVSEFGECSIKKRFHKDVQKFSQKILKFEPFPPTYLAYVTLMHEFYENLDNEWKNSLGYTTGDVEPMKTIVKPLAMTYIQKDIKDPELKKQLICFAFDRTVNDIKKNNIKAIDARNLIDRCYRFNDKFVEQRREMVGSIKKCPNLKEYLKDDTIGHLVRNAVGHGLIDHLVLSYGRLAHST